MPLVRIHGNKLPIVPAFDIVGVIVHLGAVAGELLLAVRGNTGVGGGAALFFSLIGVAVNRLIVAGIVVTFATFFPPSLYHYFSHMLFSLLCMPGHLPLVFPCRLEGMPVKEADGKLIWSRDVNVDNLLTENRLTKFLQTHSVRTEVFEGIFLDAGALAFSA